jgi:hypothetical protein
MEPMKRPLIVGHRPAGATEYHFRVFGRQESRFPPAELRTSLRGLAQWIAHGTAVPARERGAAAPLLRVL